jgi:hypothetical protein
MPMDWLWHGSGRGWEEEGKPARGGGGGARIRGNARTLQYIFNGCKHISAVGLTDIDVWFIPSGNQFILRLIRKSMDGGGGTSYVKVLSVMGFHKSRCWRLSSMSTQSAFSMAWVSRKLLNTRYQTFLSSKFHIYCICFFLTEIIIDLFLPDGNQPDKMAKKSVL